MTSLELCADTTVPRLPYFCGLCAFHNDWADIVNYNLVAGAVSPNLWVANVVGLSYVLSTTSHHVPCSHTKHRRTKATLERNLGYSALGTALYSVLAVGIWVMMRV